MVEQIDETRRIASEMGEPALTETDWDVFFGRRNGTLSPEASNKIIFAYTVAQSIVRKDA